MDKEPNRKAFASRNPDWIEQAELVHAAKWWAINATAMPPADPWKSHMALLPIVALLARDARDLEQWLVFADRAVNGGLRQTIYADARLELISERPPWKSPEWLARQNGEEFRTIRSAEMQRLIDEIRVDASIQIESGNLV